MTGVPRQPSDSPSIRPPTRPCVAASRRAQRSINPVAHSAFIEGEELATGEQEVFSTPGISAHSATVWDHRAALRIARAPIELDGQPPAAGFITLTDDGGAHKATVRFS